MTDRRLGSSHPESRAPPQANPDPSGLRGGHAAQRAHRRACRSAGSHRQVSCPGWTRQWDRNTRKCKQFHAVVHEELHQRLAPDDLRRRARTPDNCCVIALNRSGQDYALPVRRNLPARELLRNQPIRGDRVTVPARQAIILHFEEGDSRGGHPAAVPGNRRTCCRGMFRRRRAPQREQKPGRSPLHVPGLTA